MVIDSLGLLNVNGLQHQTDGTSTWLSYLSGDRVRRLLWDSSKLKFQFFDGSSWADVWSLTPTVGTLIYRGNQIKETATVSNLGALSSWDIVNFLWRANIENETYPMTIFPKMASSVTYYTGHFDNGTYWANARVWGGSNNVLGVSIDSAKDNNWKPGIIQIIGYKFS